MIPYGQQKTPGRAPCDAQPGCESSLDQSGCSGSHGDGSATTATPLLDQAERPGQERRDAPETGGIDLGDTRGCGSNSNAASRVSRPHRNESFMSVSLSKYGDRHCVPRILGSAKPIPSLALRACMGSSSVIRHRFPRLRFGLAWEAAFIQARGASKGKRGISRADSPWDRLA